MYRLSWECVICVPQGAKILSLKDKKHFCNNYDDKSKLVLLSVCYLTL